MKKLLIALGSVTSIAAPVAIAVSCSDSKPYKAPELVPGQPQVVSTSGASEEIISDVQKLDLNTATDADIIAYWDKISQMKETPGSKFISDIHLKGYNNQQVLFEDHYYMFYQIKTLAEGYKSGGDNTISFDENTRKIFLIDETGAKVQWHHDFAFYDLLGLMRGVKAKTLHWDYQDWLHTGKWGVAVAAATATP